MFDEAISLLSIWSSINNWLTPTTLFLLLNLMIGTIFITSSFTSSKSHHHHNIHNDATTIHHHHHDSPPSQLTRTPSVLQRLKSINFYNYYPYATATVQQPNPSTNVPQQHQSQNPQPQKFPAPIIEEDVVDDEGPTLDEIYNKIKGTASSVNYNRQNSDTKPSGGDLPVRLPAKINKSASDMSAFNHFQPQKGEVSEVDVRADDFITKFKKQLQLQRIESIAQYKEMITRGSAK